MLTYFKIIVLLCCSNLTAQVQRVETVYFEFDKYNLYLEQEQTIIDFIMKADTATIESIQLYGYCDDRGNADYNYKLSEQRVNTVKNVLTSHGFNNNKIVIIEGKGRITLTDDAVESIGEIRSKNRRVDLMLVRKNSSGEGIYNSFHDNLKVGDRIFFEKIYFELGSSILNYKSRQELDKIVKLLDANKGIEFEIIGHVCCTPSYYSDAIDRATNERKLSINRAKQVFLYLMYKNVNSLRMPYKGVGNKFPLGKGEEVDRRVEFLITKI